MRRSLEALQPHAAGTKRVRRDAVLPLDVAGGKWQAGTTDTIRNGGDFLQAQSRREAASAHLVQADGAALELGPADVVSKGCLRHDTCRACISRDDGVMSRALHSTSAWLQLCERCILFSRGMRYGPGNSPRGRLHFPETLVSWLVERVQWAPVALRTPGWYVGTTSPRSFEALVQRFPSFGSMNGKGGYRGDGDGWHANVHSLYES